MDYEENEVPLEWHNEKRKLRDMIEWPKNPRRLTELQANALKQSLERFGYVDPIILNFDGKSIIGGHIRRKVIIAYSLVDPDLEVDVRLPNRPLSEREKEELAIRLNRDTGEWDYERLSNEFEMIDLLDWGFVAKDFDVHPQDVEEISKHHGTFTPKPVTCPECGHTFTPGDIS